MDKIYSNAAKDLGIPKKIIKEVYTSFWQFIKETTKNIDFDKHYTEEEFMSSHNSFNLPRLGNIGCSYKKWQFLQKHRNTIKNEN